MSEAINIETLELARTIDRLVEQAVERRAGQIAAQGSKDLEELLEIEEVARLLKVSENRVYELIQRYGLPAVTLGERAKRVEPRALREWLKRGGCAQDAA